MTVPIPIQSQGSRRGGLQSVSVPVPLGVDQWREGIEFTPSCGVEAFVWACSSADRPAPDDEKPLSSFADSAFFYPTLVGVENQCLRRDMGSPIGDVQKEILRVGMTRTEWSIAAQVLYSGDLGNDSVVTERNGMNPSFYSAGQVLASQDYANPADLDNTIQGLLDAACTCFGEQITLHVPQQYMPHFLSHSLIEWVASEGRYYMGNIPVSFDCYPNLGPEGVPAPPNREPAVDGSEVWMYVTSTPMVSWGAVEEVEAFSPQLNARVVELVRPLIVAFDPCCVYAAKAVVC